MPMPDYDAIVIGAGHNGLTAAAVMARGGLQVLCLGAAAGCTNLFHSDAKPEQTYVLRAPSAGTTGTALADGAAGPDNAAGTDGAATTAATAAAPPAA